MEVEPRIAKQYKCHHCCSCKYYQGKGVESGEKVYLRRFFRWPDVRDFVGKMFCGASYTTSDKLLLVDRHTLTTGLQKCLYNWLYKIRKFTVTSFHCEERTHRK